MPSANQRALEAEVVRAQTAYVSGMMGLLKQQLRTREELARILQLSDLEFAELLAGTGQPNRDQVAILLNLLRASGDRKASLLNVIAELAAASTTAGLRS